MDELAESETAEAEADRAFVAAFSLQERVKLGERVCEIIMGERGWTHGDGDLVKDGVRLNSSDAFTTDPIAASVARMFYSNGKLANLVRAASPQEVRKLRIAFQAGQEHSAARAYLLKPTGGRAATVKLELDTAIARWKTENPGETREPGGKDLCSSKYWPMAVGASARSIPSVRTIQNLISKYYPRRKR